MIEEKWRYSLNEEDFQGELETREEAIKEAINECKEYGEENQDFVWIGQMEYPYVGVNVDLLLENISDFAYDQVGEYADSYLQDVTLKQQNILEERLNKVIYKWMKEFNHEPTFFMIENVERIDINNYF